MILETRIDGLTLIVDRKQQTTVQLEEGVLNVKCALGYEISNLLGVHRKAEWKGNDFSLEDGSIYFANFEDKLEIQIKASLCVFHKDYENKINQILSLIKEKGFRYRFTRLDICYVVSEPFFKELLKSDFKNLTTIDRKKKKETFWFSAFSTIFGIVFYDKQKQLKKLEKSQPKYFKIYRDRYGERPIYHLELRFFQFVQKNSKTKVITQRIPSILETPFIFEKVKNEIKEEIFKRIKLHKKIAHLLKKDTTNEIN